MLITVRRARPILLLSLVLAALACYVGVGRPAYVDRYPWGYNDYGTVTVVRRPVVVVDRWTGRTFRRRPYRRYTVIRRHHSPLTYTATRSDDSLEVKLNEMGDSTSVEVRARKGGKWERERARALMNEILQDYK